MIKMLLTVALLGSAGFSGLAMAQDKRAGARGDAAASSLAKLEAQCAHRRIMPPDPRDDCARQLRSNAQLGYGQDDASASSTIQAVGAGSAPATRVVRAIRSDLETEAVKERAVDRNVAADA